MDGIVLYDSEEYYEDEDLQYDTWTDFKRDMKNAMSDDIYVIFGTFGRWDGEISGGGIVEDFDDLVDFMRFRGDHHDIFKDVDGELEIIQYHHDGSNHYTLRPLTLRGKERYRNHMNNVGRIDGELVRSLATVREYTRKARIAEAFGLW